MELKVDKTTKILLGAIALGLFLNASNVFIDKAYAKDCASSSDILNVSILIDALEQNLNRKIQSNSFYVTGEIKKATRSIESTISAYACPL